MMSAMIAMPRKADHVQQPVAAPRVSEQAMRIACGDDAMIGILARPQQPAAVGVVIIVGGPQYRAGSHRQFTLLSRHLAAAGHAVLRFDCRGMGDSGGEARDFLGISADIEAAIEALRASVPEVQQVVLWGLCDAATAALLYIDEQPRSTVAGLCLLNPWVRSAQTQAAVQVKHYYTRRLADRAFWLKLLRGQVGAGRLAEFWRSLRTMRSRGPGARAVAPAALSFQHRMARAWRNARCPLLLVLSGQDLTAREFTEALASDPAWQGALTHPLLTRVDLDDADHTFSNAAARDAVAQATTAWLRPLGATAAMPSVAAPISRAGR